MAPSAAVEVVDPGTRETLHQRQSSQVVPVRFSPRERQVVRFITDGRSNQDIAAALGLRIQTVKNHLSRIYRKLGVPNRVQLAVFAVNHGFGPSQDQSMDSPADRRG
jgi:DNA-binding NarL/FixJ family response regulator